MSQGAFRELITRLSLSAGALTAVGVAIDAKVTGNSLEPEIQLHVDGVLDALGARDAIKELGAAELRPVLAEIRLTFLHGASSCTELHAVRAGLTPMRNSWWLRARPPLGSSASSNR